MLVSIEEVLFFPLLVSFIVVWVLILRFVKGQRGRRELSIEDLAKRLKMSRTSLVRHDAQYRTRTIPKRSGGKRILHVPDDATKQLQRKLLQQLIERFPIHDCVHGFRKGHSIVDNAAKHIGKEVIVKLDIADFFPLTNSERVKSAFRGAGFNKSAASLLNGLTCYEGGLPQGAPTSPALSNYVNKNMDEKLAEAAITRGAVYTRYADDITFSFGKYSRYDIHNLLIATGKILRNYGYRLNNKKKRIIRQHRQQLVTGLVVNERVNLPRKTRRWLRAVKHRLETGREATLTNAEFRGWLSFLKMVDADSPLLTFLGEKRRATTNSERIVGNDAVNEEMVRASVEVQSVAKPRRQPIDGTGKHALTESATAKNPTGIGAFSETNEKTLSEAHLLVEMVEAIERTEKYSIIRKEAEAKVVGSQYLVAISAKSIDRTFSFRLPKKYQNGQTVKATLYPGSQLLELYLTKEVGMEIERLRLPAELKVLLRVVQWNSIFKRIEAVVLEADF
jgi:retron-type reverse transcriptase